MFLDIRVKSQITIPKELMNKLGLSVGDKLEIFEEDGGIRLVPVAMYSKQHLDELRQEVAAAQEKIALGEAGALDNLGAVFAKLEGKEAPPASPIPVALPEDDKTAEGEVSGAGGSRIKIRMAQEKDVGRISNLIAASWKSAYRGLVEDSYLDSLRGDHWVEYLRSGLRNRDIFAMVLQEGGKMIGASILGKTTQKLEVNLISLYLLPEKIGQGLGRLFYAEIEKEMRRRSFNKCVLDVLERNERAIRFYKVNDYEDTQRTILSPVGEKKYVCRVFEKILR